MNRFVFLEARESEIEEDFLTGCAGAALFPGSTSEETARAVRRRGWCAPPRRSALAEEEDAAPAGSGGALSPPDLAATGARNLAAVKDAAAISLLSFLSPGAGDNAVNEEEFREMADAEAYKGTRWRAAERPRKTGGETGRRGLGKQGWDWEGLAGRWRWRSRSLGFGGSAQPTHLTLQVSSRAASLLSALGVCVMRPRCKIIIDKELAIDLRLLQCERN